MILLPTEKVKATKEVPGSLIIFGLPKSGKTTAISQLPNNLIIDVERGSDFVDALKVQPDKDIKPVALFKWIKDVAQSIKNAGRPYDFVTIDTTSYLDEQSEWKGTWDYMQTPQGKKFNRLTDERGVPVIKEGKPVMLRPSDPAYESVHTLADGNGYRWSRAAMTDLLDDLKDLGRICTLFICHVKDKYVVSKQSNTEVRSLDLSLTGKVRDIYARDIDAIGYLWNSEGQVHISFKGNEDKLGGMRGTSHLQGYEGVLDWGKIFKL